MNQTSNRFLSSFRYLKPTSLSSPQITKSSFSSPSIISCRLFHLTNHPFQIQNNADEISSSPPPLPSEILFRQTQNNIGIITLNRPQSANAMGSTMISQLRDILKTLKGLRCIILTSNSPKVFSAGADLRERKRMTREETVVCVDLLRKTFDEVANLPMPVLAALEGVAVGGGLELALAADIRIASTSASFGLPETSLAIIPGAGGTQRLPRLIGMARAKELIYTARRIDADTALRYGLVEYVVEKGHAEEKAMEMAKKISKNGPIAIQMAKRAIQHGINATNFEMALDIERDCYAQTIPTKDRLEGLASFREGRRPVYRGE